MTEEQFTNAAAEHLDMVYRIALNWFRNAADAEDIAQTVMLRLWQSDKDFGEAAYLRHWLVRVTLNACKDLSRTPWRRHTVSLEVCRETAFSSPEGETLFREVMALPAKYRLPLYLYYYEGYSVREVGELLGLNPSTVQTRLARARDRLRQSLEEV